MPVAAVDSSREVPHDPGLRRRWPAGSASGSDDRRSEADIGLRLRPGLGARQQEAERLRRLPEATMQEFHDAGILRVIQPAAFGGFEADFICQIDLTYEIAHSCGASGWVYAVLSAHAAMIANFSERAQQEVWSDDPCALASSSLSSIGRFKRVDGGCLVSGFWRYSSGCDYCAWLVAGADASPLPNPPPLAGEGRVGVSSRAPPFSAANPRARNRRRLACSRPCRHRQQIASRRRRVCARVAQHHRPRIPRQYRPGPLAARPPPPLSAEPLRASRS